MAYVPSKNFSAVRQSKMGVKAVTCQTVLDAVNEYFETTTELLIKKTRKREILYPRQVAMYFMAYYTVLSLKAIGVIFDKDHTTVIHAIEAIDAWLQTDDQVKEQINLITQKIQPYGASGEEDIRGGA